jgi:hypothetical protein
MVHFLAFAFRHTLCHRRDTFSLTGREESLEIQRGYFASELGMQMGLKRFEPALEFLPPRGGGEKGHRKTLKKRKGTNPNPTILPQSINLTK